MGEWAEGGYIERISPVKILFTQEDYFTRLVYVSISNLPSCTCRVAVFGCKDVAKKLKCSELRRHLASY